MIFRERGKGGERQKSESEEEREKVRESNIDVREKHRLLPPICAPTRH